jgi:hypothetical protein
MRITATICTGLTLADCAVPTPHDIVQSSVFARPGIVYQSGDNIGVNYPVGGVLAATNEREAVALIEQYCKGQYRVVRRGGGLIDAGVCPLEEPGGCGARLRRSHRRGLNHWKPMETALPPPPPRGSHG